LSIIESSIEAQRPPASQDMGPREGSRVLRTAGALLSVQGITWLTSLTAIFFYPRFLGSTDFGRFALAHTVALMAYVLASFGTSDWLVKTIARDPEKSASLVVHVVAARLAIWSVAFLVIVGTLSALVENKVTLLVIAVYLISAGFNLIGDAARAALQGHHSLGRAALVGAICGLAGQAVIVIALLRGGNVVHVVAITAAANVAVAFAIAGVYWNRFRGPVNWRLATARLALGSGASFLAWQAALTIYGWADYLVLAFLADSRAVGEYAFAYRLIAIPVFVPTIIAGALYPSLAAASARKSDAWFSSALTDAMRYVFLAVLPMSIGLIVLAPQLTDFISGEAHFSRSTPIIATLSIGFPLIALNSVIAIAVFARDKQRKWAVVAGVAAVANPALNFAGIPLAAHLVNNPALGAAVVTVMTEVFMTYWAWRFAGADIQKRVFGLYGMKVAVAAVGMGIVVFLLRDTVHVLGLVPLGAAVYATLAFALRLITRQEFGALSAAFRKTGSQPAPLPVQAG
jgi:O-antigen/teichoic acid export membrane protein